MLNRVLVVLILLGFVGRANAALTEEQDAGIRAYQSAFLVWQCKENGYIDLNMAHELSLHHSKASFKFLGIMGPHPALQSAIQDQINSMKTMTSSDFIEACDEQVKFYDKYVR